MIAAENGSIFLSATFSFKKKKRIIAKPASEEVSYKHYLSLPPPNPSFCLPFKSRSIVKAIFFFSKNLGIILAVLKSLKKNHISIKETQNHKHLAHFILIWICFVYLAHCNIFPLDAFDFPFSKLVLWKPMVKEMLAYTNASCQQWGGGGHCLLYWIVVLCVMPINYLADASVYA